MMVNIQIIMYQTTLYDIFFIDMIKRHKKGYNVTFSYQTVLFYQLWNHINWWGLTFMA